MENGGPLSGRFFGRLTEVAVADVWYTAPGCEGYTMHLRRVQNSEEFVKVRAAHIEQFAWLVSGEPLEDGAEVHGIASEEVAMYII